MDEMGVPGETPRRDQLTEDASLWFARMRGPDAEGFRLPFEAWIAQDPAHLGAYNRAGEIFALGKFLAANPPDRAFAARGGFGSGVNWRPIALAACAFVVLSVGAWINRDFISRQFGGQAEMAAERAKVAPDFERVSADQGSRRMLTLEDGSSVVLEPGSILGTRYGAERRELRLERGRARFEVAHETRPFIVYAGGGSVTARGTIFDVVLDGSNEVTVHLLRGAVDVARPDRAARQGGGAPIVARLAPGETFSFGAATAPVLASSDAPPTPSAALPDRTGEVLEFEKTPLSQVIAQTNQGSAIAIRLGDPSIGALQVSGRFRIDDPEQVADRLGTLFNLRVERPGPAEIILAPR